jgi:hypothetical protein
MTEAIKLDQWIPLGKAARMAGVPVRKFRKRMYALDARAGGGILRHMGEGETRRHMLVSAEALRVYLRTDPTAQMNAIRDAEQDIETLRIEVQDLKKRLEVEKRNRIAFQRRAHSWLTRRAQDPLRPSKANGAS